MDPKSEESPETKPAEATGTTTAANTSAVKPDDTGSTAAPYPAASKPASIHKIMEKLPKNRFELELEFVQALSSPAYIHFLATNASSDDHNWLDDPEFIEFLRYLLRTWSKPEYNRFLIYPQGLYFLEWLLNHRREEWAQVGFRNFAHQQQFMNWQHRASRLYGRGSAPQQSVVPPEQQQAAEGQPGAEANPAMVGAEVGPQPMQEG